MRTIINRRAFLRTAASASAIAAGAGAVTIVAAGEHHDAELIALGIRFDRVFPRMRAAEEALRRAQESFRSSYIGDRDADAFYAAQHVAVASIGNRQIRLYGLADAITERIRRTPASTLAGLAVKARALKHDLCMACDDPAPREDWDFDDECLAVFIDEIERMALAGRA